MPTCTTSLKTTSKGDFFTPPSFASGFYLEVTFSDIWGNHNSLVEVVPGFGGPESRKEAASCYYLLVLDCSPSPPLSLGYTLQRPVTHGEEMGRPPSEEGWTG